MNIAHAAGFAKWLYGIASIARRHGVASNQWKNGAAVISDI